MGFLKDRIIDRYKSDGLIGIVGGLKDNIGNLKAVALQSEFGVRFLNPPLQSVIIEPTNRCNYDCIMCTAKHGIHRPLGDMSLELFKEIITSISRRRYPIAVLLNFAGEPLLNRHFNDMVRFAGEKKFGPISFNTNAEFLDKTTVETVLEFVHTGVIGISIDGYKETNERIRRGSSYERIIRNLEYLIKLRNSKNSNIGIKVNITKSEQSLVEIASMIKHFTKSVDFVQVNERFDNRYRLRTRNKYLESILQNKRMPCPHLWYQTVVLWNGQVSICCYDLSCIGILPISVENGDIFRVWSSSVYKALRLAHLRGEFSAINACSDCQEWAKHYVKDVVKNVSNYNVVPLGTTTKYCRSE